MQQDVRHGGREPKGQVMAGQLPPGTPLAGGGLQIVELIDHSAFGETYRAKDGNGTQFTVHMLETQWVTAAGERAAHEIASAKALKHKNIAETYGLTEEGGRAYVVGEYVEGQTLRALIEKKRQAGGGALSLKAAFNVIAHVCNALSYAHSTLAHGALSSTGITVNADGRVKIGDFGLSWARYLSGVDRDGMPPELRLPKTTPTPRSDVYSVGCVLYELLLGEPPGANPARPSGRVPGLPAAIDIVMARCLNPNPDARFASPLELKEALTAAVEGAPLPKASGSLPAMGAAAKPLPGVSSPSLPKLPPKPAAAISFDTAEGSDANFSNVLVNEDDERFLVQKNRLDFGPFSIAEIKRQIDKGDIQGNHTLVDRDSGERGPVRSHPLLSEAVREAEEKFELLRRAQAEAVVVKQQKRGGTALYGIFFLIIATLGIGGYFVYTKLIRKSKPPAFTLGSAELEVGSITASKGSDPVAGHKTGGGRRSGGGGAGGTAWDDELNLGDASQGGGSETLPTSVIDGVLAKNAGRFASCVRGSVRISFQIYGTGKVGGVKVNGSEAGDIAKCIRPKLQSISFPKFNGVRMAANFSMSRE